jgi:hypothetical protein
MKKKQDAHTPLLWLLYLSFDDLIRISDRQHILLLFSVFTKHCCVVYTQPTAFNFHVKEGNNIFRDQAWREATTRDV